MRLLNINRWHGLLPRYGGLAVERIEPAGHQERRFAALVAAIEALAPDIVTVQECLPQPRFTRRLAEALGYDATSCVTNAGLRLLGVGIPTGLGAGDGLAILARRELAMTPLGAERLAGFGVTGRWGAIQVGEVRKALGATFVLGSRRLAVVSAHLRYAYPSLARFEADVEELRRDGLFTGQPSAPFVRKVERYMLWRDREMARLGDWLATLRELGCHVALGADLNMDPDAPQVQALATRAGLINLLPHLAGPDALTWDPRGNPNIGYSTAAEHADGTLKGLTGQLTVRFDARPQTPDHLMVDASLEGRITGGGLALDEAIDGVFPSDHYGVWVDLDL